MFPCTNAPRLPNIGFTSTRASSGTSERNRSLSASVGLGICIEHLQRSRGGSVGQAYAEPCPVPGRTHQRTARNGTSEGVTSTARAVTMRGRWRVPIIRRLPILVAVVLVLVTGTAAPPAPTRAAAALPALPASWPSDRLELGLADAPGGAAALHASAPFKFRYQYLAGGVNTGNGWSTWNTNGQFVSWYIQDSADHGSIAVFPYYMLLQSNPASGSSESAKDLSNLANPTTMAAFYADLRLFFQRAAGDHDGDPPRRARPVGLHRAGDRHERRRDADPGVRRELRRRRPGGAPEHGRRVRQGDRPAARPARAQRPARLPPLGLGHELGYRLLEQPGLAGRHPGGPRRRLLPIARRPVRPDLHRHRRPGRVVQADRLRRRRRLALGRRRLRPLRPVHRGVRRRHGPSSRGLADPPGQHEDARDERHVGPLPGQPGAVVPRGSGRHPSGAVARRRGRRPPVRRRRRRHDVRLRRPATTA